MRGYIFKLDSVGWLDVLVAVCCFHRCSRRLNTSPHTHMLTAPQLISALLSYVSYAVNQQACRPVAIPPDCQTQLAYLRTICVCAR